MRVMLTNDDGFEAPGLRALYQAVSRLSDVDISIIAPAEEQSGKGHTFSGEIRCQQRRVEPFGEIVVVEGSPADCVRAGLLLPEFPRPDWVLSGINRGGNLGVDVYNSGTVAAAREAAVNNLGGMAISQLVKSPREVDWERTVREAAAILAVILTPKEPIPELTDIPAGLEAKQVLAESLERIDDPSEPFFWNVNLPHLPPNRRAKGVRLAPLSRDSSILEYETIREDGVLLLRSIGKYMDRKAAPETDVALTFDDYICISRVHA